MRRALQRLVADRRGVSALEFALIAPILALVLVFGIDGWMSTSQLGDMRNALQTAARYYQVGGGDDDQAQDAALAAWTRRPTDGEVSIDRLCRCGTSAADCSSLCSGDTPPAVFVTLEATSQFHGAMRRMSLRDQEVLRVR
jgi:Flp pilus assembly protein TadG